MKRTAWVVAVLAGVAVGAGVVASQTRVKRERLRAAIALEAQRTAEGRVVNEPESVADGDQPADEREAIERLRGEMEALKQRLAERNRAREMAERTRRATAAIALERSIADEMVPAAEWRNRGRTTPTDAMETALWAAAGGEVAVLAEMLELAPAARTKAEALLARLPESIRAQSATPEQLVALLGSNDVPLGSAMILTPDTKRAPGTWRVAQISDGKGQVKRSAIALTEKNGSWSLVVPERAIDRYAALLSGGATPERSAAK